MFNMIQLLYVILLSLLVLVNTSDLYEMDIGIPEIPKESSGAPSASDKYLEHYNVAISNGETKEEAAIVVVEKEEVEATPPAPEVKKKEVEPVNAAYGKKKKKKKKKKDYVA